MIKRKYYHDLFGGEAGFGSIADFVILVSDPLVVEDLSKGLDDVKSIADHYEFIVRTGYWKDIPLTLCSTGLGGGSAAIAIDNLVNLGAKTLIYVGEDIVSSGNSGLFLANGAIRYDGASLDYVRPEFPALIDPEVYMALIAAVQQNDLEITPALMCSIAFPLSSEKKEVIKKLNLAFNLTGKDNYAPVLMTNPEVATVLTLSTIYRLRAGIIYNVVSQSDSDSLEFGHIIKLALEAVSYLHNWDLRKILQGWKIITPDY